MSPSEDMHIRSSRDLGHALREARKRQALTQLDLAESAGLSRQHLVDIERGKTTERIEEVLALLELLGLDLVLRPRRARGDASA